MHGQTKAPPKSWLAFDLNVLRRMKFASAALPFSDQPALGAYLKRSNVRVLANDPMQSVWTRAFAEIANNGDRLSDDEVNLVLEDAYVPGYRHHNLALATWFSEIDSWWFDNVRRNIDRLQSPMSRAIASSIAIAVGDYVLSFKEETRELRQPLSTVYRRLWSIRPEPFNNGGGIGTRRFVVDHDGPSGVDLDDDVVTLKVVQGPASTLGHGRGGGVGVRLGNFKGLI